jgi:hypothetical protein
VRASTRLTESPACLVAGAGFDRELSRLLARQNRGAGPKPILELNMRHPIVQAVGRAKADARAEEVTDLSALLFEQAKILDGEVPDDPAAFASRLNRLVIRASLPGDASTSRWRQITVQHRVVGKGAPLPSFDISTLRAPCPPARTSTGSRWAPVPNRYRGSSDVASRWARRRTMLPARRRPRHARLGPPCGLLGNRCRALALSRSNPQRAHAAAHNGDRIEQIACASR